MTDVSLQFDASTTSQTVMVTIVNDDILENSETFSGNLMTSDSAVNFVFQMATVTILEEAGDGKWVDKHGREHVSIVCGWIHDFDERVAISGIYKLLIYLTRRFISSLLHSM